jgi:hypothetical protein
MRRRRAATPTDDPHPELLDELAEHRRHRRRLERVDRVADARVDWQSGVRDDGDRTVRARREEPDRLAHVLGASRAVEADHVDR